jgi:hypothetical protein
MFNVINKFNVQAVNTLYNQAGVPTAAFDSAATAAGLEGQLVRRENNNFTILRIEGSGHLGGSGWPFCFGEG